MFQNRTPNVSDDTIQKAVQISKGSINVPFQPVNWPNAANLQNQIQQIKAQSRNTLTVSNAPGLSAVVSPATGFSTPSPVSNIRVTRLQLPNKQVKVTVSFDRNPADTNYTNSQVLLRQANGQPSQTISIINSPATIITARTSTPTSVTVQSQGNLGSSPIARSPGRAINLI